MDKEEKDFFEKLAGVEGSAEVDESEDDEEKEAEESFEDISEEAEGQLAVDVYQNANSFIVESPIAGVDPENIDISISSESITIRGKRVKEERVREDNYLVQECYWGRFMRSVILPQEVDPERAQAIIKNGVLRVILPKINKAKAKKIKVKFD